MKFTCDKCGAQYKIKDEKIGPNGVSVRCKKCDHKIIVRLPKKEEPAQQFPEFPTGGSGSDFPSDTEATRQLANPLLDIQKSEGGASSKPAPAAEPKAEKKPEQKSGKPSSKEDEFGLDSPSGSVVSSLPFDLGLGKDEDLGKALDPLLSDKPADDSPFSASFGTDDGGSEPDEGNATRVVNLAAMASLMKAAAPQESDAAPATSGAADDGGFGTSEPSAPAPAPGEEWYVAIDGQQQGPMDFDGVKAHWDKGEISTDSLVWNPSMSDWAALGTVPELSKKLEPPKPAMSDIPAAASSSPALDEWGMPVAAEQATASPSGAPASAAATLPSPQAAPEEPAWKPAAASMLSSLLQDEMSALDAPPKTAAAPAPASPSLLPAINGLGAESIPPAAALPQPSAAPSGVLPDLAPMPAPSSIPVPAQDEFQLPPPPSPGMEAGDGFGDFPPPMDQNSDGPLPGIGADLQNGRDATEPGGFSGNMDDAPAAWEVPAPALPRSAAPRSRQGANRRQGDGNGRRAHHMPIQPLPQMPSRMPGAVKGAIGLGVVVLLIVISLAVLKHLSPPTSGDSPVVAENQAAPVAPQSASPANPAAQASPLAAASPAAPAATTAAPAGQAAAPSTAAPEASPAAPEAKQPAAAAAVAPAEPAKAAPEPAEKKEKAAPPAKKAKKAVKKKGGHKAKAVASADEEDGEEYEEEEEAPTPVAAAPEPPKPAPEPAKPEPSSKVDDDFERLFGGGGASAAAEPAKPAPAKKPTVYVPPPTGVAAKATLSQSDIMGEVMKHRGDIKRCTDDEEDSGTIVMSWTIQKSGKPANVKTDTGDYKGSDLEHCLKGVINSMKFPPYSGDQMQPIKFPFRF